jgi:hypothetical protein
MFFGKAVNFEPMRNLNLLFMLTVVFAQFIRAQTACYSFDDVNVPANNKQQAFNIYGNGSSGFLEDWYVTSGTPSIYASGDLAGVNAYSGNQYTLMTICDAGATWSEGAAVSYNFVQDQNYTVSMAIRNAPYPGELPTPIDIEYVLLQNPITYTYNPNTGCSPTPAIPVGAVPVHTISSFAQNSWQTVSFNINNLTSAYSQLWIRVKFSAGAPLTTTFFCLDSLCIQSQPESGKCYSFDDTNVPNNNKQHAFNIYGNGNAGFLEDWKVTSGTPAIQSSGDVGGINAYDGNQFALLAICDAGATWSEGVTLDYSFTPGQSYQVSMAIRNAPYLGNPPTPIDVEYVLLDNPIAYTYNSGTGCSPTPSIPANSFTVHTITGFNQNAWQVISFNVGNLNASYNHLWIRVKFSSGAPITTTFFCFDSVCVQPSAEPEPPVTACYSFDDANVSPSDKQHAFNIYGNGNTGFLEDWKVTSGTPSIYASGDLNGVNAYDGNQYALMTICDAGAMWSEGASVDYNFNQGQNYTVSMAIRNAPYVNNPSTPIDVEFILLQSPITYTYNSGTGCSPTPNIPANAQVVHTITGFDLNKWIVTSFNITNLTANYGQLWVRVKFAVDAEQTTTFFCLDSMCIGDYVATSGVADVADNSSINVTAFPNPFSRSTTISVAGANGNFEFELVDVNGKLIKKVTADDFSSFEVERDNMVPGIYFYSITTQSNRRTFGKLVVQ